VKNKIVTRFILALLIVVHVDCALAAFSKAKCGDLPALRKILSKKVNGLEGLMVLGKDTEYNFEGIMLADYQRASLLAFELPVGVKFGFVGDKIKSKVPYISQFEQNPTLYGRQVSWKITKHNGDTAVIRLDRDVNGIAHMNIVYDVKASVSGGGYNGGRYKYRIAFECKTSPCSDSELLEFQQQIMQPPITFLPSYCSGRGLVLQPQSLNRH
jgi:hypothetical protein